MSDEILRKLSERPRSLDAARMARELLKLRAERRRDENLVVQATKLFKEAGDRFQEASEKLHAATSAKKLEGDYLEKEKRILDSAVDFKRKSMALIDRLEQKIAELEAAAMSRRIEIEQLQRGLTNARLRLRNGDGWADDDGKPEVEV